MPPPGRRGRSAPRRWTRRPGPRSGAPPFRPAGTNRPTPTWQRSYGGPAANPTLAVKAARPSRVEEVGHLHVEGLRLLDEQHVSRVADDDLLGVRDSGRDLIGAHRSADEVLGARDDEGGSFDANEVGTQVERVEDLAVEELQRVRVWDLGPQRVQVARLHRAVARIVKRQLLEDQLTKLLVRLEVAILLA